MYRVFKFMADIHVSACSIDVLSISMLTSTQVMDQGLRWGTPQGVHRLLQRAVDLPPVDGVQLGLDAVHLGGECVNVRIGFSHLLADGLELSDHVLDALDSHGDILADSGSFEAGDASALGIWRTKRRDPFLSKSPS